MKRWLATVWYRTDNGSVDVRYELEELKDLHDIIERGPHFDTVESIRILRINHVTGATLTIEQSKAL